MTLCFATNNKHKVDEVKAALPSFFNLKTLADIGCSEELEETAPTLEGNSLQKANYVWSKYKVPCFADDTGLEVEALNGAPGVYSARYAGLQKSSEDNISLLLLQLEGKSNRKARFRTVFTLLGVEEGPVVFEGIVNGTIINEKQGDSGFGYDPVFVPEGFDRTFAQMSLAEKNGLSHRALALRKLVEFLQLKQY
jgi:XTP/dITP diphosphohydrolase